MNNLLEYFGHIHQRRLQEVQISCRYGVDLLGPTNV